MIMEKCDNLNNIYQLNKREKYIPYMSQDEYFKTTSLHEVHAVTTLSGKWICQVEKDDEQPLLCFRVDSSQGLVNDDIKRIDENGGRLTFKYERQFTINDYDYSKDYHLNISDVSSGYTLKVNGRYVGQIPSSVEASEFDITSLIHGGENRIEMSNVDQPLWSTLASHICLNTHLSENMYILERDNDRLVHFEVEAVCQQDTEQILVTVKIKEVEGLPAITYTLIGLEGEIEAQGNIDLDYPCIIPIDASFEVVDLLDGYTLFLETDYETVAYFINKRDISIK